MRKGGRRPRKEGGGAVGALQQTWCGEDVGGGGGASSLPLSSPPPSISGYVNKIAPFFSGRLGHWWQNDRLVSLSVPPVFQQARVSRMGVPCYGFNSKNSLLVVGVDACPAVGDGKG